MAVRQYRASVDLHQLDDGGLDATVCSTRALTVREREIVTMVAKGMTSTEIAALLGISCSTVNAHLGSVLTKLGARTRRQAVLLACGGGAWSVSAKSAPTLGEPTDRELLELLAGGMSVAESAVVLGVSRRTAHRRLARIREQLRVSTVTEAIFLWARSKAALLDLAVVDGLEELLQATAMAF